MLTLSVENAGEGSKALYPTTTPRFLTPQPGSGAQSPRTARVGGAEPGRWPRLVAAAIPARAPGSRRHFSASGPGAPGSGGGHRRADGRAVGRGAGAGLEHVTAAPALRPPSPPPARLQLPACPALSAARPPAAGPSFFSSQCHRAGARAAAAAAAAAASAADTMVRWARRRGMQGAARTSARPPSYPGPGLCGGPLPRCGPRGSRPCGRRAPGLPPLGFLGREGRAQAWRERVLLGPGAARVPRSPALP